MASMPQHGSSRLEMGLPEEDEDVRQLVKQVIAEFGENVAMLDTKEQGLFIGNSVSSSQHDMIFLGPQHSRGVRVLT